MVSLARMDCTVTAATDSKGQAHKELGHVLLTGLTSSHVAGNLHLKTGQHANHVSNEGDPHGCDEVEFLEGVFLRRPLHF